MTATTHDRHHVWVYVVAAVALVALAVVGVIRYQEKKADEAADAKAQQLAAVLADAGYGDPDPAVLASALGADGGTVCSQPLSALDLALWRQAMANGASGPGMRAILTDGRAVKAEKYVLDIYCPDKAAEFDTYLEALNLPAG